MSSSINLFGITNDSAIFNSPPAAVSNDGFFTSTSGAGVKSGGASAFAATAGTYTAATAGAVNAGGGGGAGTYTGSTSDAAANGASGGSGVIQIKYPLVSAPILATSPVDQTVVAGESATFSASFGTPVSEITWQKSTNAGTTWTTISSSTTSNSSTATYSFTSLYTDNGARYRAVGTNINGAATAVTYSVSANLTVTKSSAVLPTNAVCDGSSTQNNLTATAGHGKVFYIDTGQGQEIDAGYIAYGIKSTTARSDLWVEVSNFAGGVISLADPSTSSMSLGALTANATSTEHAGTAFFMVKATAATLTAQSHIVRVYDQKPSIGNPDPLYQCNFSFTRVEETIKAAANKVESVVSSSVTSIGSTMTITVKGDSGTIGQGNDIDGRMFWLIPAARSSWPVNAVRLEKTELKMFSDSNRTASLGTFTNTLRINNSTGLAATTRQFWTAEYTFRVIGPAASVAPIIPIAMISSGTQIKHTDVAGVNGGTLNLADPPPPITLEVNKNVSSTTEVRSDGTTRFKYEIELKNTGANPLVIDEVVDEPDAKAEYVTGTAKYGVDSTPTPDPANDFVAIKDPGKLGTTNNIAFTGPLVVPANSTRKILYEMAIETCKVGQSFTLQNTATARSGSVTIGSGTASQSVVTVNGNCGATEVEVFEEDVPLPPDVITGLVAEEFDANSKPIGLKLTSTMATITGSIDPNGVAGRNLRFTYSTSPTLATQTEVNLSVTTNSTGPYKVETPLTGLTPSTTYYYRLEVQVDGIWQLGEILSFTTPAVLDPQAVPVAITKEVTQVTDVKALFNGTIDANGLADGVKVKFEYVQSATCPATGATAGASTTSFLNSEVTVGTPSTFEDLVVTGTGPTLLSFEKTGLAPESKYCVRILGYKGGIGTPVAGEWVSFETSKSATVTTLEIPVKKPQTITWDTGNDPIPAGGSITVQAYASSLLPVKYTSVDPSICTVNENTGVVTAVATSGNCSITATQIGNDGFYSADPQTITFLISPPVITTTSLATGTYASSYSQTILATGGNGTYSTWTLNTGSELPPGLSLDSNTGVISGTATTAGIYVIYVTTVSNGITSAIQPLTITINKVPLTVRGSSHTLTFGDSAPSIAPVYNESEFISPDTSAIMSASPNVAPTCSTDYSLGTAAGINTKTTKCFDAWATNYSFVYAFGEIKINPFKVTITAVDAAKNNQVSGANTIVSADPTLKYQISPNLPSGQTITDVLSAEPTLTRAGSGTATGTQPTSGLAGKELPGEYTITPSGTQKVAWTEPVDNEGTFTNVSRYNYEVTYVVGKLTISEKIIPVLNIPTRDPINYNTDLTGQLNASATHNGTSVPGTYVYSYVDSSGNTVILDNSKVLPAGNYTINVTFTPTDGTTYFGPIQGVINLIVKPLEITVTAVDAAKQNLINADKRIVNLDPDFDYVITPPLPGGQKLSDVFANGVTVTRDSSGVAAGTYSANNTAIKAKEEPKTYAMTASGESSPNYKVTFVPGVFTITEKIVPTVAATDSTKMVGDSVGSRLNATSTHELANVPGTFEYSYIDDKGVTQVVTSAAKLPLGFYTIKVKFTPTDTTKYYGPVYGVMVIEVTPYVAPSSPNNPSNITPNSSPTPTPTATGNSRGRGNPGANNGGNASRPTPNPTASPSQNSNAGGQNNPNRNSPFIFINPMMPGIGGLINSLVPIPGMPANPISPTSPSGNNGNNNGNSSSAANYANNGMSIVAKTTVDLGAGVIELTDNNLGQVSQSSTQGQRSLNQFAQEKLGGFHPPGSGVRIEVLGARSGARFVLSDAAQVDAKALMNALGASIQTQAADFFTINEVKEVSTAPEKPQKWTQEQQEFMDQFFAGAGLPSPRSLADLNYNEIFNWVGVSATADTYVPGSTVYLTVTSEPLVLASAVVDKYGKVEISGAMPVEFLNAGEHRIRLVGTRSLDGVFVDDNGEIQVTDETLTEIERFDLSTQATIGLIGTNINGGSHVAMRVIPLIPTAPWWTIALLAMVGLGAIWMRRNDKLTTKQKQLIANGMIIAATLPAIIFGWLSTVTSVVWVGIALSIVLNVLARVIKVKQKANHQA